jgi:hypothetical protein
MIKSTVVNPLRGPIEKLMKDYIENGGKIVRVPRGVSSGVEEDSNLARRWFSKGLYSNEWDKKNQYT